MIPVKEFFTGGRAIFTVEVPESFAKMTGCRPHYTYRIHLKKNKKDDICLLGYDPSLFLLGKMIKIFLSKYSPENAIFGHQNTI